MLPTMLLFFVAKRFRLMLLVDFDAACYFADTSTASIDITD